jgi:hypothetical protein
MNKLQDLSPETIYKETKEDVFKNAITCLNDFIANIYLNLTGLQVLNLHPNYAELFNQEAKGR